MSLKRKKTLEKRERKKERALRNKQEACERVLWVVGLMDEYLKLPEKLQQRVRRCGDPRPIFEVGQDDPSGDLRKLLPWAVMALNWAIPLHDDPDAVPISYCELNAWFHALRVEFHIMAKQAARHGYRFRGQHVDPRPACEILRRFRRERFYFAQSELALPWIRLLGDRSRLDRIFSYDPVREVTPAGKVQIRYQVRLTEPQRRSFVVDGRPRTAYRLHRCRAWIEVDAASLPAALFGLDGGDLPVYIQQHVLERMDERLRLGSRAYLFTMLNEAMEEPQVLRRPGGEFLLPVRLGPHRIGYLVARLAEGTVVLKTFLFLTMQGTPEADRLRDQLRLTRADIEFTMLDSLDAFTNSDMRQDETLMRLLETCGCGHLCRIASEEDVTLSLPNQAKAVRDHLRIAGDDSVVTVNGRRVNLAGVVSPSLRDYRAEWRARNQALMADFDDLGF